MNKAEFDKAFPLRASERYGGIEAVGSTLWLEHTEGIRYEKEDGSTVLLRPEDLTKDESMIKGSPHLKLMQAMSGDTLLLTKEQWLREYVLRMLPLRITGDKANPPLLFNAELKVFTVPQKFTVNPGVIAEEAGIMKAGRMERDSTKEQAITFALRFTPQHGAVKEFAYYPSGINDYGIGALEESPDLIRMQLGHRIYFELYRKPQSKTPAPLIPPYQF